MAAWVGSSPAISLMALRHKWKAESISHNHIFNYAEREALFRRGEKSYEDRKKRKNTKKIALSLATLGVLGTLAIGGTMAYLTDAEKTANTFTVGKVQVDLEEPNYPGNDSDAVKNLVPNQVVAKDPQVENTGNNASINFLSVSIPMKNVVLAADDGTKEAATITELFQTKSGTGNFGAGNVNNKWVLVDTKYYAGDADKTGSAAPSNATTKVVRVYGYNEKLAKGATSATLFDSVKLVNLVEGQADTSTQNIDVKAYAIQATDIANVPTDTLDQATLKKVYDVYVKQSSTDTSKVADSSNTKNLKGATK